MARVVVPLTTPTRAGVAPGSETNGDATNNHTINNNDGKTWVLVRNSGAGARTVTFLIAQTVDGQAVTATAKSLAAGVSRWFGPFPPDIYGDDLLVNVEHAEIKLSAYHFA